MKDCPKCGAICNDNAKFCSDCGYVCAEICTPQMLQEEVQDDA